MNFYVGTIRVRVGVVAEYKFPARVTSKKRLNFLPDLRIYYQESLLDFE